MIARVFLAACLVGASPCSPVAAQVRPQPGNGDPRLQSIEYQADQVFLLEGVPGYQLMVELAPDEQIQSVAIGDSSAWQVNATRGGNRIFVKPLQAGAGTNMTVTTNVRVYAFDLTAAPNPSPNNAYTVRFRYPSQSPGPDALAGSQTTGATNLYTLRGARALRPSRISDDGIHTYMEWPTGTALPAVYLLDEAGRETLANGNMRSGVFVVDSVARHLVFRIDRQTARADRMPVASSKK